MTYAIAAIRSAPLTGASLLVCLAACLGGLLGRIIEDLRAPTPTLLLGLSPLELLVIFFAARALLHSNRAAALAQLGQGELYSRLFRS